MSNNNVKTTCEYCNTYFQKSKYNFLKSNHHFCSRKCGLANATKKRWKNHIKKEVKCENCNKCCSSKSKLCQQCKIKLEFERCSLFTVKQIKIKHLNHPQWYSSEIRNFNRTWNSHLIGLPCQNCNHKYTVLCHIKPISNFDINTTLSIINSEENNIVLCRNCHYMFDEGFLKLKDISKRNGAPRKI